MPSPDTFTMAPQPALGFDVQKRVVEGPSRQLTPLEEAYATGYRQIEDAERKRMLQEVGVTELLAGVHCPEDVRDFGRRHKIENFAETTWVAGFMAGMRVYEDMQREIVAKLALPDHFLEEARTYAGLAKIFGEEHR